MYFIHRALHTLRGSCDDLSPRPRYALHSLFFITNVERSFEISWTLFEKHIYRYVLRDICENHVPNWQKCVKITKTIKCRVCFRRKRIFPGKSEEIGETLYADFVNGLADTRQTTRLLRYVSHFESPCIFL